jgi:hypothetical protein
LTGAAKARGVVAIVPGFNSHGGYYNRVAEHMLLTAIGTLDELLSEHAAVLGPDLAAYRNNRRRSQ